jgi:hypothetical protein
MIRKSVERFSEKIMLKQRAKARIDGAETWAATVTIFRRDQQA